MSLHVHIHPPSIYVIRVLEMRISSGHVATQAPVLRIIFCSDSITPRTLCSKPASSRTQISIEGDRNTKATHIAHLLTPPSSQEIPHTTLFNQLSLLDDPINVIQIPLDTFKQHLRHARRHCIANLLLHITPLEHMTVRKSLQSSILSRRQISRS